MERCISYCSATINSNCILPHPHSNRVLAHLPYMIALDHAKRAVVLAIR